MRPPAKRATAGPRSPHLTPGHRAGTRSDYYPSTGGEAVAYRASGNRLPYLTARAYTHILAPRWPTYWTQLCGALYAAYYL